MTDETRCVAARHLTLTRSNLARLGSMLQPRNGKERFVETLSGTITNCPDGSKITACG